MSQESVLWTAASEAAQRVERAVADIVGILAREGIGASLVEGSALSAELSSSDELVRRFASRASVAVHPADIDAAERALAGAGWRRAAAQGDLHLLRTAVRHGRHLVFALLDQDAAHADSASLHPAHPESARRRHERLSRYRMNVRVTLAAHRSHQDDVGRTVTETFELGLVESDRPAQAGTVSP